MKAFSKAWTVSELTLTPIRRALTKRRNKRIFRHGLKTITTRVVKMLYPRDTKHIGYNIRCDNNAPTSNASNKKRYWKIKSMRVGVELFDQHGWTGDQDVTQWLPFPTVDDNGKVSVEEVQQDDLAFRMNASLGKFLKEVLFGLLIMKPDVWGSRIKRSGCPRTKRVPGQSRLRLDAIEAD